ncbi:MAG: hypothetical protein AB1649_09715 [Chloroflexota bacterium]
MKTIIRIGIILLAALVVVGVTMAVTNSSGSTQTAVFEEGNRPQMSDGSFIPGERPEGGPGGERGGDFSLGWVRHMLVISGIMFIIVMIERLWGKFFRPRLAQAH